ncbi:MAG: hypothetical protein AAFP69_21360, partial [Planctomycetota bacterium]
LIDWSMVNFVLEQVDWEEPFTSLQIYSWMMGILSKGFGGILLGFAVLSSGSASQPGPGSAAPHQVPTGTPVYPNDSPYAPPR